MLRESDSKKIVIAGASSLRGAELRSLLEESRFADADFYLVDEEIAAGTLTKAGGEAAVIQAAEEESFLRARFVFFTGSAAFTRAHAAAAQRAGARVVDLSGGLAEQAKTVAWFPKLDAFHGRQLAREDVTYVIPSAAATATAALSFGLAATGLRRLQVICFQPVSEAGRAGIEELESQTGQLLLFQKVGQPVFDTQVAFSMLDRYGPASSQKLHAVRDQVRAEVRACLAGKGMIPAVQIVHAPVFYGTTFAACAELDASADAEKIAAACKVAGFVITAEGEPAPSSMSVAGESALQLAQPEADPAQAGTWWFWGAADNIRLPAANAVKLAELLS
jgi:aspartate-semialdehyde dehydrogenase